MALAADGSPVDPSPRGAARQQYRYLDPGLIAMAREPHRRHSEKHVVIALSDNAQKIVDWGTRIVGFLGVSTFISWFLGNLQRDPSALLAANKYVWQGCVILYFTSWVAGVTHDKRNQEKVYAGGPEELKISPLAVLGSLLVFALFTLMFVTTIYAIATKENALGFPLNFLGSVRSTYGLAGFVLVLNVLWIFNVIFWRYYVSHYIRQLECRSQAIYHEDSDYFGLIKLGIIKSYIDGNWQWYRYAIGGVLLVACDAAIWSWRGSDEVNSVVVPSLVAFLAVVEGWIWLMRLKVDHSLDCVDEIARNHRLVPHGTA